METVKTNPSGSSNDEARTQLLAGLSNEELATIRLSERLGRPFSAAIEYASKEALTAAFEAAKTAFPQAKPAYQPSGKTTPLAVLVLIAAAPVLLVVMTVLAFGLCWALASVPDVFGSHADPSYMERSTMGKLDLLVDLVLVIGMSAGPLLSYGFLSKLTKNRNPFLPAILTAVVNFILAIILFAPVWHGETLAPTHLAFIFIPVRWILIFFGCVLSPLISVLVVFDTVSKQKFCEASGCFLKKYRQTGVSFDYAENALALLIRGDYERVAHLPKATPEQLKAKHVAEITLWWHDHARIAFLELEIKFHSQLARLHANQKEEFKKTKTWIAYSVELQSPRAEVLGREMPG
jgi:hypothetical protein